MTKKKSDRLHKRVDAKRLVRFSAHFNTRIEYASDEELKSDLKRQFSSFQLDQAKSLIEKPTTKKNTKPYPPVRKNLKSHQWARFV